MIEPKIAFADLSDDINLAEDYYLKYCVQFALENCAQDLEFFENSPHGEKLLSPTPQHSRDSIQATCRPILDAWSVPRKDELHNQWESLGTLTVEENCCQCNQNDPRCQFYTNRSCWILQFSHSTAAVLQTRNSV